ncbi:MAG: TatD family hydrolase [Oscillospiraceae bacterium]|jgi:TatD DNase family protein|nr:TatD family hydrolase [Oscillospiraceae bacterium]
MYFDSHAHLDSDCFDADRAEILADLENHQVSYVMNVGCDLASSEASVSLAEKYPCVYAAVGSHPDDADRLTDETLARYRELCKNPRVRAIGEIGLDYHYEDVPREIQKQAFVRQLELAEALCLPVIVHQRDAQEDAMEIIRKYPNICGVFHCFSGSAEFAQWLTARGWYIGFTGVVTFKNARRPLEVVRALPMDRIVIETDCPYMSPEPYRGRRNDSRFVPYVGRKIAEIRGMSAEEVAAQTTENAKRLFGIL